MTSIIIFLESTIGCLSEIVLSFAGCDIAVLNSVGGAMMITAHAMGAVAEPMRAIVIKLDIMQRARFRTTATTDACIRGAETAVGDDKAVEERPQQIGLCQRKCSPYHFIMFARTVGKQLGYSWQVCPDFLNLTLLVCGSV